MAGREVYEFGEFTLDVSERRLTRVGQVIPLAPKPHDLLVALIRNAGRLVTKRELLQLIWPESFVEEGILSVHISALRKALGEGEGERRRIETVARVGYRFIGDVTQTEGSHGERAEHAERHGVPAAAFEPLKQAHATGGRMGVVRLFLERAQSQPQAFPAMQLALFYGEAGEMDQAFQHLDIAVENHDPALVHLAVAPQWDSLRADPRFNQCLIRMWLLVAA